MGGHLVHVQLLGHTVLVIDRARNGGGKPVLPHPDRGALSRLASRRGSFDSQRSQGRACPVVCLVPDSLDGRVAKGLVHGYPPPAFLPQRRLSETCAGPRREQRIPVVSAARGCGRIVGRHDASLSVPS